MSASVQSSQVIQPSASKKKVNYHNVANEIAFTLPMFKLLLIKEEKAKFTDWVQLQFSLFNLSNIQRKADSVTKLKVNEFKLIDLTMPVNSSLVSQRQSGADDIVAFELNMQSATKDSPLYQQVDSLIFLRLANIDIKFQPETIN